MRKSSAPVRSVPRVCGSNQMVFAREVAGIFVLRSGTGVPPVNITRKMRVPPPGIFVLRNFEK